MAGRKRKPRRLLIMACSARKFPTPGSVPAIQRYDGVAFRVVKKLLREGRFPDDVDVLILSARFGLIESDHPIPDYDVRMTSERAREQSEENRNVLGRLLASDSFSEVFISAGRDYSPALEPFEAWRGAATVTTNKGKIGVQLKSLKGWLLSGEHVWVK